MLDISIPANAQQHFCSMHLFSSDANEWRMNGLEQDRKLINDLAAWADKKPSRMATDLGMAATTLARPASGKATTRLGRSTLQVLQEAYPDFPGWSEAEAVRHSDHTPTRSIDAGETATVMRMDLSYAMGPGTNIDDHYIEGEPVQLDISFLRRLTPSAPEMLRIVNGIGDSMQPTIHDSEELILDLGQRTLNLQDRIWAMSLYGVGAVKRLKAIGRERVLVISDNPDVPDQEVEAGDLMLVGRIVGSIRRH